MASDTIVTTGTVRGNTIVLKEAPELPEGARVTVMLTKEEGTAEERERELYDRLESQGLMTIPKTPAERFRQNKPIRVKGKPLSQIIIEDRR